MIPGAIDESALLHVHISYLTRYSADEFSALIGFPLFLVTSLYRLSRFPLRPLSTSTLIILILDLLSSFFHGLSIAVAVIAVIVVAAVAASSCPPAMPPRSRSEKPDGIFIYGLVHNKTPPFPRESKIADRRFRSWSRQGLCFCFDITEAPHYFRNCVEKCWRPASPQRERKIAKITWNATNDVPVYGVLRHTQERRWFKFAK